MNRSGPFGILRDEDLCERFDDAVITYIQDLDFRVMTIVIDKLAMRRMTHWKKMHPYHFLMEILIEKYARFLLDQMSTGDIMPEARKGKMDRALQEAFTEVRRTGTDYMTSAVIAGRIPVADLKFKSKRDNIAGLQLCDLIAHPSHQFVRRFHGWTQVQFPPFAERVMKFVHPYKYHRRYDDHRIVGFHARRENTTIDKAADSVKLVLQNGDAMCSARCAHWSPVCPIHRLAEAGGEGRV